MRGYGDDGTAGGRHAPIEHVVVVVTAHDDADRVGATLVALERSRFQVPDHLGTSLVLVADRCADDTADVARRAVGRDDAVLELDADGSGRARSAGVAHALTRLDEVDLPVERVWLASTDAGAIVHDRWLARHLEAAADGAVAVAGPVLRPGGAIEGPARGRIRPSGANLGVRADAYLAAGGWSSWPGERVDDDLWRRVSTIGPVVVDPTLDVVELPRRHGRHEAAHGRGVPVVGVA